MKNRPARLLRRLDRFAPVTAMSVVVYGELCFGRESSRRRDETAAHISVLLETIRVLPLPLDAGPRYGEIRADLERRGLPIGANDTWIAAHALAEGLTLVTNNEREFARVPGLRIESWTR